MNYFLVADIGGTKLATALFTDEGTLIGSIEVKSENKDGELLFKKLVESFEMLLADKGLSVDKISGIGVGIPGIVDPNAGIAFYQNNLPWRDFPLKQRLHNLFPDTKISIDNDVYMATYGEFVARSFTVETFVYVTVSTGISCCTISEGKFIRGAGMAGEIGFSLTSRSSHTLEASVAGPILEKNGRVAFNDPQLSLKDMMLRYYEGDLRATSIVGEAVEALAKEIFHILLFVDPTCIVIGGGVFNNHPALVEAVRVELRKYLDHPLLEGKEKRIEASIYKGSAGLQGAFARCR